MISEISTRANAVLQRQVDVRGLLGGLVTIREPSPPIPGAASAGGGPPNLKAPRGVVMATNHLVRVVLDDREKQFPHPRLNDERRPSQRARGHSVLARGLHVEPILQAAARMWLFPLRCLREGRLAGQPLPPR